MDAVIGVSVTPSTVGMVLVEGDSAADFEAVNLDLEVFDVAGLDLSRARAARDEIVATVARAESVAADNGRRLRSIGVTWSDGADVQAAELVADLNEAGFGNVVDVRFRQATDALAHSIADIVGFDTTVVCVVEPEGALALTVDRHDGVIDTVRSRTVGSAHGLIGWLERVLTVLDRHTSALVVVGSAVDLDFDRLMPKLQAALGIPVFTPADADLALARGAALVSARRGRFMFPDDAEQRPRWTGNQLAPAAMLLVGVVTFVVSLSLAITQQLMPHQDGVARQARPVVNTSGVPAALRQMPPSVPAAPSPAPAPPVTDVSQAVPTNIDPPLAQAFDPPIEQAPPQGPAVAPPVASVDAATALPPPPVVTPAPPTKKPLLTRIRDRLRGEPDVPEQVVVGEPPPPAVITPIPPPAPPPIPPPDPVAAPEPPPAPPEPAPPGEAVPAPEQPVPPVP